MQGKTSPTSSERRSIGEPIGENVLYEISALVAEVKGCDPLDLRPLSEVVDPEALETLLLTSEEGTDIDVRFPYEGGYVRVNSSGVLFDYDFDSP